MMSWTEITDLPATRLYEDEYGNIRRRSTETGRFISGTWTPAFGHWGYGKTIRLDVVDSDAEG